MLANIGLPFLLIGAPGEDIGTAIDAGKVHYLRGTTDIAFDESQVGAGGLENDDRFGYALASTGYQFAIAQPGEAIGSALFSGSVCLYTHTITSAIMGVGATKRLSAVRWGVAGNIVTAWILTIPAAALVASLSYFAMHWLLE